MDIKEELIEQSIIRLDEYTSKIKKCLGDLSEDEMWYRSNNSSNSMGNLILHLCGNITQYIISALGNKEDDRKRDEEFNIREGYNKNELLLKLLRIVSEAKSIIANLNTRELLIVRSVQGFNLSGVGIVIHVVEHFSYHTGQIAFWTKLLRDKDLEFYDNVNLNQKNKLD